MNEEILFRLKGAKAVDIAAFRDLAFIGSEGIMAVAAMAPIGHEHSRANPGVNRIGPFVLRASIGSVVHFILASFFLLGFVASPTGDVIKLIAGELMLG